MIKVFGEDTPANRERMKVLRAKWTDLNKKLDDEFREKFMADLAATFGEPAKE